MLVCILFIVYSIFTICLLLHLYICIMAYFLPHLHTAYAVDCAIQDETEKLVVIRFGHDNDKQCMLVYFSCNRCYYIAR